MRLFMCDKWQWTCSVAILIFSTFLGIPSNNRVSGATLRNYAVLTYRSDDLEQNEAEKVFVFHGSGNKHPGAVATSTYSQTPSFQQHNYNQQQHLQSQQQHQQYQLQQQESPQQYLQQPVVDIQITGGTLQTGYDHDQPSSLLELGTSLMPSFGGTPLQASTFFSSSTPQRPPASQVAPAINQLQYPSQLQQSTSQQQQFQETQTQQSASTQAQQPHLEQPSPSPAPPQELPLVPSQQQESHFTPPQLPPAQEEPQHLSSQQLEPPQQVQQVSSHSHQSSSSPTQQQSQEAISQQQHYSKPPPLESVILEQYQSVVHTEPQSPPEHPQAPYLPLQLAETVHESSQQVPPQLSEAPQVPPQLSDEVHLSPLQHVEVAAAPSISEPSIDQGHFQSVETIPSEQSSSADDHPSSTIQEVELPQEQPAAPSAPSFLLVPQNSINSPLQSYNFGAFNKPQLQEDSQLSNANQPQDQSFSILDKPGSLMAHLNGGSLLSNSIPSSGQEQATSSSSNEHLPASHEQSALPSVLGSTGGWSPLIDTESVSGPTLIMDTSIAISSAAAVSSTHMEALNLIGDHDKPAMAEIQFGSDAHHGVSGNTNQISNGSTQGTQNSEGQIDGGSSQMYEFATMGEHNEVLVSGSSGSEAIGSVLQQSLADTIMAEAPVQQQTPVEMPLIELSPPQLVAEAEVPLHLPQIEPQLQAPIELAPQHIEDVPLEIPQIEPQVVEAPIVLQVTVPDPMPTQQSSSQFNQIADPHNNLIQASQQDLLQYLLFQQQQEDELVLQKPSDSNQINEAVSMVHSSHNQVQQSSVNQLSNNLIVTQQESSKVEDEENKLSEKISGAFLKQAKILNQVPFTSDWGEIVPEQEGLFAAILQ